MLIGQAPDPFWQVVPWILVFTWPIAGLLLVLWFVVHVVRLRKGENMTWPGIIILFILLVLGSPLLLMVVGTKTPMVIVLTMMGAIFYKVYRDNNPLPPAAP